MNDRWLVLTGVASLVLAGSFAACTQDFDAFNPVPTSGQGGSTTSDATSGPGTGGASSTSSTTTTTTTTTSSTTSTSTSTSSTQSSSSGGPMCGDGNKDAGE